MPGLPITLMDCRHGPMFVLASDIYIGRALALFGENSEAEVALLTDLVQPGAVVVEAGANMGTHTVPLARRIGSSGKLYAYEPQRVLYGLMRANLAVNNLAHIVDARLAAVDEIEGTIHVPFFDYAVPDNFGGLPITLIDFTEMPSKAVAHDVVPACTIDALNLTTCALIKADVEGMEIGVIGGATETIQRCRPILYLEAHAGRSRPILLSLDAMGYRIWRHLPPLFSATNYRGRQENPWPGVYSANVLALPDDRPVPKDIVSRHTLLPIEDLFRDNI